MNATLLLWIAETLTDITEECAHGPKLTAWCRQVLRGYWGPKSCILSCCFVWYHWLQRLSSSGHGCQAFDRWMGQMDRETDRWRDILIVLCECCSWNHEYKWWSQLWNDPESYLIWVFGVMWKYSFWNVEKMLRKCEWAVVLYNYFNNFTTYQMSVLVIKNS